MKPTVDAQVQEEQSQPNYRNIGSSKFNPNELPPSLQQFIDAHRGALPSLVNFPPTQPPFHPPPYPPQLPPPPSSYFSQSMKAALNPRSGVPFCSSSGRSSEGGISGRTLTPDLLQLREAPPPSIIGIPSAQRRANERRWQQLNDDRYFALVGATAVTHCYSGYTQLDNEKELLKEFNQDVDALFKRFSPPDFLSKEQKQQLHAVLQNLEITWNASFVNMTKLHESSNRFMAFNINVGPPASPLPSLLQHKFRALAHAALKILALPIRPSRDHPHIKSHPSRGLVSSLSQSKDYDFWREVSRRFPGDHRTILKGWLLMNFAHPYPNEHDKAIMAQITGMTRVQIGNWFINQRVRWWRPLVEELASELQQEVYYGNFPPIPPHPPIPGQPPPPGFDILPSPGGLPPPPPHVLQHLQKQFPPEFFQSQGKDFHPGSGHNMFSFFQSQNGLFGGNLKQKNSANQIPNKESTSTEAESTETPIPQKVYQQTLKTNSETYKQQIESTQPINQEDNQQVSSTSYQKTEVIKEHSEGEGQDDQVNAVQELLPLSPQVQNSEVQIYQEQVDLCQKNMVEQLPPPSPQVYNSEVQICQGEDQDQEQLNIQSVSCQGEVDQEQQYGQNLDHVDIQSALHGESNQSSLKIECNPWR